MTFQMTSKIPTAPATIISLTANLAVEMPEVIRSLYQEKIHPLTSDEFHEGKLDTQKWTYRTKSGSNWGSRANFAELPVPLGRQLAPR